MKHIPLVVGAILFSILFHKQGIGLNLSIFSLIALGILSFYNPKAFAKKSTIAYSIMYLVTALSVFFYNNALAITANTIAFITLVGQVSEQNSSIYVNWLNGIYTSAAGFFHRNFAVNEKKQVVESKDPIDYLHLTKIIIIPLVLLIIFISLYSNGNPFFNSMIKNINVNFINFQWILVAFSGYYLLKNISQPVAVDPATSTDKQIDNELHYKKSLTNDDIMKEHQLGFILISALNFLIIIFLSTDIAYLLSSSTVSAPEFSNQVHSGIYALIGSIVIAILIILYFFRGDLNFYSKNKSLKIVAYTWMLLNAILVINIFIKDFQYIYFFGFTYKRIGVLVYLILTIIGLITTFIKVKNLKNFWYLFRINTVTAFTIMVVACTVNWDSYITIYNLNYAQSMDLDYLIELSNNNTFILKKFEEEHILTEQKSRAIERKYVSYLRELKDNSWQEFKYDNLKIKQ